MFKKRQIALIAQKKDMFVTFLRNKEIRAFDQEQKSFDNNCIQDLKSQVHQADIKVSRW